MGLMDEINSEPRIRSGRPCAVRVAIDGLKGQDRKDLQSAIDDLLIPGSVIARVLSKRGIQIGVNSITRHRRKDCTCD